MHGAYHMPQDQGFSAEHIGDGMSMEPNQGYMDDDEMLLDGDMSGMDFGNMAVEHEQYPDPYPDDDEEIISVPVQEQQDQIHHPDPQTLDQEPHISAHDTIATQPARGLSEGARDEEEDNFEDLLGSLEDHLNEQGPGLEAGQADEDAKLEDEVAHVPASENFEAAPTAPEMVEDATAHPTQEGAPQEQPAVEDSNMNMNMDVEIKEVQAEEAELPTPEPVAEE